MEAATGASDERSALIYRHYERIYRIALLVAGDPVAAARLVERACATLPSGGEPEAALAGALRDIRADGARRPQRYAATPADLGRAGPDSTEGEALLQVFAALSPRDRLVVGLYYLRGLAVGDIDALIVAARVPAEPAAPDRRQHAGAGAADSLARARIGMGRTLDLLPPMVGVEVLAALDRYTADGPPAADDEMRARLHRYPELREARAGLLAAHQLLMRGIPALFALSPPPDLLDRLLDAPRPRERRLPRLTWAHAALIGVVALLVAAQLIAPSLVRRAAAPAPLSPRAAADLLDDAIHRLEQPPLKAGVLHEVYRAVWSDQPPIVLERWYEYADPHRMRVELRTEDRRPPLLAIASDGRGLVQFRTNNNIYFGNQLTDSLDIRVSPAELAAALPILRELPSPGVYTSGPFDSADISRFFLAAARANGAAILGTTTFRQRSAYILVYRTEKPLPPPLAIYFRRPATTIQNRVLLTIDGQTYGLLDVAVLPEGEFAGAIRHPWQMQSLTVSDGAPDEVFRLPATPEIAQQVGLPNPRGYNAARGQARSPSAVAAQLRRPLLVPQSLPDPTMRGVILGGAGDPSDPSDLRLLYDGAFISMALLPSPDKRTPAYPSPDEQVAGAFRYQLLSSGVQNSDLIMASVRPIAAPDQPLLLMLMDSYATPQEREATVRQIIGSLTPLTPGNAKALEQQFYAPAAGS